MLRLDILCVGKLKETWWRDACAEYQKRLGGFCRLTIMEVDETRLPDRPSAAQIAAAVTEEGRRLLQKLPASAVAVTLCIEGKTMPSDGLAAALESMAVSGDSRIAFLIGGSCGLSEEVKAAARLRLSLSPMTFPHQLARVMLLEQLYRSMQILSGGKYHK
ncbi:MAG: 23S rRNA (pseudouridine(1915)-N(3))-methyltransferase RlmH [Clostridiales bacterium]|nr:23S rRNA (pseudouridine(1915)-N(3))-methyltransferase RlmH [Clostridiales bacterium]